jgi:hypothetical protein
MSRHQDIDEARRRARFMRPDAARYVRPDAARFIRPDVARFLRPGTDPADVFPALNRKYSPSQRRIPSGQPGGGRWTDEEQGGGGGEGGVPMRTADAGAEGELSGDLVSGEAGPFAFSDEPPSLLIDTTDWGVNDINLADQEEIELPTIEVAWRGPPITDSWGDPYYNPGGHHELPHKLFDNWDLSPETRQLFNSATTGSLNGSIRTHPDGTPIGNYWNGPKGPHGQYNDAVTELANRFLTENDIAPSEMTPEQALELLRQIRESDDPRIRDFNRMMRLLRRLRIFRTGPRSE